MDKAKTKATLVILGVVVLFIILVVVLAKSSSRKDDKANFPNYDSLSIKEKDVSNTSSESYA